MRACRQVSRSVVVVHKLKHKKKKNHTTEHDHFFLFMLPSLHHAHTDSALLVPMSVLCFLLLLRYRLRHLVSFTSRWSSLTMGRWSSSRRSCSDDGGIVVPVARLASNIVRNIIEWSGLLIHDLFSWLCICESALSLCAGVFTVVVVVVVAECLFIHKDTEWQKWRRDILLPSFFCIMCMDNVRVDVCSECGNSSLLVVHDRLVLLPLAHGLCRRLLCPPPPLVVSLLNLKVNSLSTYQRSLFAGVCAPWQWRVGCPSWRWSSADRTVPGRSSTLPMGRRPWCPCGCCALRVQLTSSGSQVARSKSKSSEGVTEGVCKYEGVGV